MERTLTLICETWGRVGSFHCKKLNRDGKRFGFVRYGNRADELRALERLNGCFAYGYRLTTKMANQNGRRTDMMHMQKTYAEAEGFKDETKDLIIHKGKLMVQDKSNNMRPESSSKSSSEQHQSRQPANILGVSNKHIRENDILGSSLLEQSLKNIGKQDEVLGEAKNDQESDIMCETLSKSKGSSWVNVVSLGANGVTEIISENPEVTQLASLKIVPSKALEHVYNMGLNPNRRENVMEISYTRGKDPSPWLSRGVCIWFVRNKIFNNRELVISYTAQSTVLVDSGKGSFGDLVEWWVNSMVCATCSYFQTVAGPVHLGV
ncbi:hypothetical protein V6N13_092354 [Hibiscus sabdariffa]